jgi:hypothetical protein
MVETLFETDNVSLATVGVATLPITQKKLHFTESVQSAQAASITGTNLKETEENSFLLDISQLNSLLESQYVSIMHVDNLLNRKLVSFQANKDTPFYRWYKYKEGFSSKLVEFYIKKHGAENTRMLLDPFAGSGAALFGASDLGINSIGIELLPIGQHLIKARNLLNHFSTEEFNRLVFWLDTRPWLNYKKTVDFTVLRITNGAYPAENEILIKKYLACVQNENENVCSVLMLALFCILESVSYTRKDGQYLRWDRRSGRCWGKKPFNKGEIANFNDAIVKKLNEIISDVQGKTETTTLNFSVPEKPQKKGTIQVIAGSCLNELPNIEANTIDLVLTSPPYCNRYDYTRTYALELAMLGIDETSLVNLRQEMLSCTVENREKDLLAINPTWVKPLAICKEQALLQKIIEYLNFKKVQKKLNNNGIPRMVKGYFYEMACIIFELYRILTTNGEVIMVNDNVRYAGVSISVDLILSDIARKIGFDVEEIAVLPIEKGNSSQQMGEHGRDPLRKCVYRWRKL